MTDDIYDVSPVLKWCEEYQRNMHSLELELKNVTRGYIAYKTQLEALMTDMDIPKISIDMCWIREIVYGNKIYVGRLADDPMCTLKLGSYVEFFNEGQAVIVKIVGYEWFPTFEDILKSNHIGLDNTLPGVSSIVEGVGVFRMHYSDEDELKHGVVAIHIKKI